MRFFFPLLKAVFGMGGNPAVRQQGFQGGGIRCAFKEHLREVEARQCGVRQSLECLFGPKP